MTGRPIYCGYTRGNTGCTELAIVAIDSHTHHAVACPAHRGAAERWAAAGGRVTVTPVTQPDDAVPGDGQGALFELADGGL